MNGFLQIVGKVAHLRLLELSSGYYWQVWLAMRLRMGLWRTRLEMLMTESVSHDVWIWLDFEFGPIQRFEFAETEDFGNNIGGGMVSLNEKKKGW